MRYNLDNVGNLTHEKLIEAIKAIPDNVTSLVLKENNLYEKSGNELAEVFKGLPAGLTSLDLSGNHLYQKDLLHLPKRLKTSLPA